MKTKILSLLLSVAMLFSGIPATNAFAAQAEYDTVVEIEDLTTVEELSEEVTTGEETEVEATTEEETEVEATTEEETEVEATTEEETEVEATTDEEIETDTIAEETTDVETAVEERLEDNILPNEDLGLVKAVGSNGVQYKDVTYLSMKTVNSMDTDDQSVYYKMCDAIAEMKESGVEGKDIGISLSKDGELVFTYKLPIETVCTGTIQQDSFLEENVELIESYNVTEEKIDGTPFVQLDTLMLNEVHFRDQLSTEFEKKLFDNGKKSIVQGSSNSISASNVSVDYWYEKSFWTYPANALSALINTYPHRFDWMDLGPNGDMSAKLTYNTRTKLGTYKFTVVKSKHYSSTLEKNAQKKVNQLVAEANAYAAQNYPNSPTYGIIKYFNDWICENNYYNYVGTSNVTSVRKSKEYYYCHSSYGILLKGYGVCESYALAMTRLLDAAGIRNIYVVGDTPGGGHAWNYVQMPNGNWYLLDSTWNDSDSDNVSLRDDYLLVKNDGEHFAEGRRYDIGKTFTYPSLAGSNYSASTSETTYTNKILISDSKVILQPGKKKQLSINTTDASSSNYYEKFVTTWSSNNTKVAKVDKNGKITAGTTPGTAIITAKIANKQLTCTVYVYKITGLQFESNKKSSYTWNYANPNSTFESTDSTTVNISVVQKNPGTTASDIASYMKLAQPTVKTSKSSVAEASVVSFSGNTIKLKVVAKAIGSAKITVSFAGKKATVNVKVTQALQKGWFNYSNIKDVEYTGKAFKPAIVKSDAAPNKVKYKVSYKNNKNAGEATVSIKGTGSYGGEIIIPFEIYQKDITTATFKSCTASNTYNGKAQKASTVVKLGKTTLKYGRDYEVYYNNSLQVPTNADTYTVTIKGIGNYKGNVDERKQYTIKPTTIAKVTVSCPSSVKYTGSSVVPNFKVKIGSTVLSADNYSVSYIDKYGNAINTAPSEKGKHTLVITPKGNNVLPTTTKTCIKKTYAIK